jgi:hypothetical protein
MSARLTTSDIAELELSTASDALAAPAAPAALAATYARHAAELVASVEQLLAEETAREGRPRTLHTLRMVAVALKEQHGELDRLAERLERAVR